MSKEYQDVSWAANETTLNENYLSAAESSDNNTTQYFSILEDSVVHDDTAAVQLDTCLGATITDEENVHREEAALLQEQDQVMLYRIHGSDDMYAVQVAEDETGKLQKYQFKVRPTGDGQYEAVQETITVIPFNASDPIIPNMLEEAATDESAVPNNDLIDPTDLTEDQTQIKCEDLVVSNDDDQQHQLKIVEDEYDDETGLQIDQFQYDVQHSDVDSKEGILDLESSSVTANPNQDLKIEYYPHHDNSSDTADEHDTNLILNTTASTDEPHSPILTDNEDLKEILNHQQQNNIDDDDDDDVNDLVETSFSSHNLNEDTAAILADNIEYVGVQEPTYDSSIIDESTRLDQSDDDTQNHQLIHRGGEEEEEEEEEDVIDDDDIDDIGTEYILATDLQDDDDEDDINDEDNGEVIFLTNDELKSSTRITGHTPRGPIKTYLDATQLQQLTLAAAASNNNRLPPNAAYIVTKIINENQSITTTATSIDQGVKLVRNLRIKRIGNPPTPNNKLTTCLPPVPALVFSKPAISSRLSDQDYVTANVTANVISNMLKPNPRSILKASQLHSILLKATEDLPEEQIDKRFARSKELQRKRMFRDYIAQTTIVQAPIRQERLPRKQLIKPVHRTDEEIIVREIVIPSSGNGFLEATFDKTKEINIVNQSVRSYEQQPHAHNDSDSDFKPYNTGKRKRKYKKRKQQPPVENNQNIEEVFSDDSVISPSLQEAIDLSADSEGEEVVETIFINSTGKRRGRPPKSKLDLTPPTKRRGRPPKQLPPTDPLKPSTPPEETIRIIPITEHGCIQCSKVFPSVGSLRSHMNFHKYTESKPELSDSSTLTSEKPNSVHFNKKYPCDACSRSFKNAILLKKHVALHDEKGVLACKLCKEVFSNNCQLTTHRKSHVKDYMFQRTLISPQKRTKPSNAAFNCAVCNKSFSMNILLEAHNKSHKISFDCANCKRKFMSKVLLHNHTRIHCVKRRSLDTGKKVPLAQKKVKC